MSVLASPSAPRVDPGQVHPRHPPEAGCVALAALFAIGKAQVLEPPTGLHPAGRRRSLAPGQTQPWLRRYAVMGLSDDRNYARYHQVLNRAVWSPRQAAGILLVLLLQTIWTRRDGPLKSSASSEFTLERRRGPKIKSLGIYRDAVRSSRSRWSRPAVCAGSP